MQTVEREAYKRAIDLIAAGAFDAQKIALLLAKECPEVFLTLNDYLGCDTAKPDRLSKLEEECLQKIREGQHVQAIKLWRAKTGTSLKDAKDTCDALRERDRRGEFSATMPISSIVRDLWAKAMTARESELDARPNDRPKTEEEEKSW